MYYRYKIKKKNGKFIRLMIILILAVAALYTGNRYKQHIFFWKYTYNKIRNKIEANNSAASRDERQKNLQELVSIVDNYTNENQIDHEACFLSGKLHYYIALTFLEGRFSELFINNRFPLVSEQARNQFMQSIRHIKKGIALLNGNSIENEFSLILAWSLFYTGFSGPVEIVKIIQSVKENDGLKSVEEARLYSLMMILTGREEEGLKFLNEHGRVKENLEGTLFLATAEKSAKRFTQAIVHYQDALSRINNEMLKKLVHVSLGEIYFNQSLYRESLNQFLTGLEIDSSDNNLRIWIGKSYLALGEKEKARAIWSEVYAADGSNREVKKLLGKNSSGFRGKG
jgi:predicted negative regulator of RcsB-dependent stress response